MATELPAFLREPYNVDDPSPWLAMYLDGSIPMADQAKQAWLEDLSSPNRQFVLPVTRPFARLSEAPRVSQRLNYASPATTAGLL